MTDTYIRWLLIITGVFTAASVGVFLQPVKQVALIYGENLTGTAVTMLVPPLGVAYYGSRRPHSCCCLRSSPSGPNDDARRN